MFTFIKKLFMQTHMDDINKQNKSTSDMTAHQNASDEEKNVDDMNSNIDIKHKAQETRDNMQTSGTTSVAGHWNKVFKPRFEIELYDEVTSDETGDPTGQWKKVITEQPIIIEAANKADLVEHA